MNDRIHNAFSRGKAFIPFVTCADPDLALTKDLVLAMAENGADIIELGIPFSDPIAEGPVIQAADERALKAGFKLHDLFTLTEEIRKYSNVALLCMTYFNPVYSFGKSEFLTASKQAGLDGIIVPDLPFEEDSELRPLCKESGMKLISMIAPTSNERIAKVARQSEGFLYCVSSLGVTGMRSTLDDSAKEMVALAKQVTTTPCAVGFGIHSPSQAKKIATYADGIIVGSAIVNLVAEHGRASVQPVSAFVREMKAAIKEV